MAARVASALVLAPASLALIWLGGWLFAVFVLVSGGLMAFEWARLTERADWTEAFVIHACVLGAAVALTAAGAAEWALLAVVLGATAAAARALRRGVNPLWALFGVPYIALPCLAFVWLRQSPEAGLPTVLWLLAVVWTTDTMALAFGKIIGGPRLAPRWSPRKTWAGLFGGVGSAAGVGAAASLVVPGADWLTLGVVALLLAVVAQAGDVTESAMKRRFGVKDVSHLIPGHGGALDRMDGLLFATVTLAILILVSSATPLAWGF